MLPWDLAWVGHSWWEALADKNRCWRCYSSGLSVSRECAVVFAGPCSLCVHGLFTHFLEVFSVSLSLLLPCFLVLFSSSLAALKLWKCFCLVYPISNNFICTEDPSYSEHWWKSIGCSLLSLSHICLGYKLFRAETLDVCNWAYRD